MNLGPQNTFRALADPTRRSILLMLGETDMSIQEVASRFDMTRAAVKKHLAILQKGELISVKTRGRERINHLEPAALQAVSDWFTYFDRFWDSRLGKLQQAIEKDKKS
ncbi:MAG: metalloregulator ArsR/SmtB family transcription factor [Pseudomonadota bacterium]